jgi:glutamyl-tRNA reductase
VPVLVLGLNYKTSPIALLERLAVPADLLEKALTDLTGRAHVREAVVLSTCNRVEVYAEVSRYHGGVADLRDFLAEWAGLAPEDIGGRAYDYFDDRAAAHLFAVTAGLDSMLVGEREIAGQIKQAFTEAQALGAVGRLLGSLFQQALRAGRRVRAETGIEQGVSSMVGVALDAAAHVVGGLEGRTVLLVGAGKMGQLAATRVTGTAARVLVTNRTEERAGRLAERTGAEVLPLSALSEGLAAADVVLSCTGAMAPVVEADAVAAAMAGRTGRPLALLDIAVPRDIDPACAALPGVTLLDVDAVRALADTGPTGEVVAHARALVEEETAAFAAWTRAVAVEPTIAALRARAEAVRAAESARLAPRLAGLDDRQRAAVESLTRGIIATLLHEPSVRLKRIADTRGGEPYAQALRELFDLPTEAGS